ncbi:MAG: PH domain-containing protein, partial [Candidatus Magasanikbacteria bacterium]|nr:PH domain-containing protein [Candidatus Magasanikbacteria bacterium]
MNVAFLIKQKEYEKVVFTLRRHPITFIPILSLFLLLMAVPVALYFLIISMYPNLVDGQVFYPLAVLLASVYYLSIYLFFYAMFVDYYLDLWIVTNDRIIDIEQNGLFSRTISELDLFRIQDVTTEVHGFFSTLFRYGDLHVKTASANINIVFRNIPNPNKIREALIEMADIDRRFHYNE